MSTFTKDWFNAEKEKQFIAWLGKMDIDKNEIFRYLELGSYEGRSCLFVHSLLKSLKINHTITTVDPFIVNDGLSDKKTDMGQIRERFIDNIREIREIGWYEHKSLDFFTDYNQNRVWDLIYVDGDHSSLAVLTDAVLSWWHLKQNGLLIFDDMDKESVWFGVYNFISALPKNSWITPCDYMDKQLCIQKLSD